MAAWADSHCHLDFAALAPQADLIRELQKQGCAAVLLPATTAASFIAIRELARDNPGFILPAFGLHPYFMQQHTAGDLNLLREQAAQGCVAIGEIGLDFMIDTERDAQIQLFTEQLQIAAEFQLPVILHARQSLDEISALLKRLKFKQGGIVHAFSGSRVQAERFIELGFCLGFGGAATYSRAQKLQALLRELPIESIVLETDAPDMRPAFIQGHNSPLYLPQIAQHLATLRGISADSLLQHSLQNLLRILRIKPCMH